MTPDERWPLPKRVLFRFWFTYIVFYSLPENGKVSVLSWVPGADWVMTPYTKFWHAICPWIAIHIFHLSGQRTTYFPTGSGDTTLGYIENLAFLVVAALAGLVWSVFDRRRLEYRWLNGWLRMLIRYTLAFTLFAYGFAKVFPLQFQPPRLFKLVQPYGEFSPMGVLWNFMGASLPYTMLAGAAEVLGGLLLLFRRTTTLGALVSFGALANVVALNFCYDVPVKLYSSNLLIMAAYLAAGDARRLANVFLLNLPAEPAEPEPPRFENKRFRIAAMALWTVLVGYVLFTNIRGGWTGYKETYLHPTRPPLYGLYRAESFTRTGGTPLTADAAPWQKVEFQSQFVSVRLADDTVSRFGVNYSPQQSTLTLNKSDTLQWSRPDDSRVILKGTLNGGAVTIELRQIDTSKYLLLNRGFHWINELPFNR